MTISFIVRENQEKKLNLQAWPKYEEIAGILKKGLGIVGYQYLEYIDDEDDLIRVTSASEYQFAPQCSKTNEVFIVRAMIMDEPHIEDKGKEELSYPNDSPQPLQSSIDISIESKPDELNPLISPAAEQEIQFNGSDQQPFLQKSYHSSVVYQPSTFAKPPVQEYPSNGVFVNPPPQHTAQQEEPESVNSKEHAQQQLPPLPSVQQQLPPLPSVHQQLPPLPQIHHNGMSTGYSPGYYNPEMSYGTYPSTQDMTIHPSYYNTLPTPPWQVREDNLIQEDNLIRMAQQMNNSVSPETPLEHQLEQFSNIPTPIPSHSPEIPPQHQMEQFPNVSSLPTEAMESLSLNSESTTHQQQDIDFSNHISPLPNNQYQSQLELLANSGYTNTQNNLILLQKHQGNIFNVLSALRQQN